jgi:drug/metabolite transporter (DMT)-like permease
MAAGAGSAIVGGTAIAGIRHLAAYTDPFTLAALRFGIGFCILFPIACFKNERWPVPKDWPKTVGLGLLFFVVFPVILNLALSYTTAARAALTLATLPLLTMAIAAMLGAERFTLRKAMAASIALGGVAVALASGLESAPRGSWKGDLLMFAGAVFLAFYNIWSRTMIGRSGPLRFTAVGMGVATPVLLVVVWLHDGFASVLDFGGTQVVAMGYVGIFGGAVAYWLWAEAISRTTPTRVAMSITLNAIAASAAGAIALGEPIGWSLVLGIVAVGVAMALALRPDQPLGRVAKAAQPDHE